MTQITEATGVLPDVIDSIATEATALAEWSDADTGVVNDQTSTDYTDNGRVLEHGPSGMFVGLFLWSQYRVDNNDNYWSAAGIRVSYSSDWDTATNSPAGNTNTISQDPWAGDVGNHRSDSFENHSTDYGYDRGGHGAFIVESDPGVDSLQSHDVTYFGSVTANHIGFAVWDHSTADGAAGVHTFEYVRNKFWNDGNQPWAAWSNTSAGDDNNDSMYSGNASWKSFSGKKGGRTGTVQSHVFQNISGFDRSEWGMVNPSSDDDTYFFRRPTMYQTASEQTPVAYIEDTIGNDVNEGGAHGDTVDHNGSTYRIFRQSGNGKSLTIGNGIRYE